MKPWGVFWLAWALVGIAGEIWALVRPAKGDTLSEHVWMVSDNPTWGKFAIWMLVAFLVWLIFHFATRGKLA